MKNLYEKIKSDILVIGVFSLMLIALIYGSIQISQTSNGLKDHRKYIEDRDARWEQTIITVHDRLDENGRLIVELSKDMKTLLKK